MFAETIHYLLGREIVTACELARFVGQIVSAEMAFGPISRFRTCWSMIQVATVSKLFGWSASLHISDMARKELFWWKANIYRVNGFPIRLSPSISVVDPVLSSDTSGFQSGSGFVNDHNKRFQVMLQEWEMRLSSCYREWVG